MADRKSRRLAGRCRCCGRSGGAAAALVFLDADRADRKGAACAVVGVKHTRHGASARASPPRSSFLALTFEHVLYTVAWLRPKAWMEMSKAQLFVLCSPVDVVCGALFVSKVLLVGSLVVWYCAFGPVSLVAVMRDATPLQRVCCARARARAAPPKRKWKIYSTSAKSALACSAENRSIWNGRSLQLN